MLDYYTTYIERLGGSPFGKIVYSIGAGALGAVILVIFFNGMMQTATLDKPLPFVVAFNAAMTGYMLTEKTRMQTARRRLFTMVSGAAMALLTVIALNVMFHQWTGFYFIGMDGLLILLLVGIVFSGLGGALCARYLKLLHKRS